MTVVKAHRFSVAVRRHESGLVRAHVPGKAELSVAVPPELHGRHEGIWSPEELLAASVASCFAVTLDAVAEHMDVPLHDVDVRAATNVERIEGRYTVTHLDLAVTIETDSGLVERARDAARRAERLCLISAALDSPVHVRVDVGAKPREPALPA
jgi:organic hydroperoxide reductase OsmC/OhrA